ncbi:hypothetical protein HDU80_006578, partial [Chytriomyces hyalinus]
VTVKEFKTQQSQQSQEIAIAADDVESFKQQLWTQVFTYIKCPIVIEGDSIAQVDIG